MFYSHDILQKRGGKFGIIWNVATREPELTRRQYMSVRVRKTCEDIMDYIFLRVPGRRPEGARPRFSLYLSSQLMYGTIKVYSKQCKFLYDDVTHMMCTLRMSTLMAPSKEINLEKFDPAKQNLPEPVGRCDPLSADFDLQFGTWSFPSEEEFKVLEQEMWREVSVSLSPSVQLELSPTFPQTHEEMMAEALKAPHTVASPEEIQLREEAPMIIEEIQIPGESELPTFDGKEIKMVPDEEEIPISVADLLSPRKSRSRSSSSVSDVLPLTKDALLSPVLETPGAEKRVEERPPTPQRLPRSPGVTPIQPDEPRPKRRRVHPSLPMELEPVSPSPARRRGKRRLRFIDIEMQITKKQLKHNMVTGRDTCIPFVLPAARPSTVEELFAQPGHKGLSHPPLLELWKRNAVIKANGWTEEEKDDPAWATTEGLEHARRLERVQAEKTAERIEADVRSPPHSTVQSSESDKDRSPRTRRSKRLARQSADEEEKLRQEQPVEAESIEVARGDSVLSLEGSRLKDTSITAEKSLHSFEQSREKILDGSISSQPRSRRGSAQVSSEEEILLEVEQPGVSGIQPLETVQEEQEAIPGDRSVRSPPVSTNYPEEMMRHIAIKTTTKTWTRFHSICGTHNTIRSYAAKMFGALLFLCADQRTKVQQKEAYCDIYISRGPNW